MGKIVYFKLWDLLQRKGIKKEELKEIVTPYVIHRMNHAEPIQTDMIAALCEFLDCQPGDIMEYQK